jgi:protein O-mannosyl-transferase
MAARAAGNCKLQAAAVLIVAIAVFANTLWGGFVFGDLQNVVQNPWIKNPGFLPEIFGSHMGEFNPEFSTWYYRPLIHVAHLTVYLLAGLRPAAFHLANVLLHAVISVMVFLVSLELFQKEPHASRHAELGPLAAGFLFATHPVHSESVAWVSGISDLVYAAFALWAFLLYLRGEQGGAMRYVIAGGLFLGATLCKEPALMLLPLIMVYEAVYRGARETVIRPGLAARLLPLAITAALYFTLRFHAIGGFAPGPRSLRQGPLVSILSALDLFARYLYTLVLPVNFSALHTFRPVESLLDVRAFAGLAVSVGLAIAEWRLRRHPVAAVGLAFIVLPLLPALYIPAPGEGAFFERYLYLPVLGFAILATQGARKVINRWPRSRRVVCVLLILLVLAYTAGSVSRNQVWRDNLSLWSDTARKIPDSAAAHEHLCFAEYDAGRPRDVLQNCRRALELDKGRIAARINVATTLSVLEDLDGAIQEFQEVLRRRPNSAEALTNLGLVYMAKGRADLAIEMYHNALRANPSYAEAHNDLGVALAMTEHREEAVAELLATVRLAPDNREYASNLEAAKAGAVVPPATHQAPTTRTPSRRDAPGTSRRQGALDTREV